jgi:SNF2 family DNA or RNA helicase
MNTVSAKQQPGATASGTTAYHAKYFAHELTKRCSSDSVEKLAAALSDAQVDLNPHQIEAALFAFRSPLSKGAILADEVGLGKTIEAGILLAQRWAERRRRLLVICPANLRKQWSQELADKFFLSSAILETRTFNESVRQGNLNPLRQDGVVICSFQFARTKEPYIRQTDWDLIVVDEAHRLRNVYKPTNKISHAIKQAIAPFQKVLLTATPLQNSLLELYGLVSIIDEFTFGDLKSFRAQFARLNGDDDFNGLKERLRPICKRTLRRQVLEYVPYTNRHALVQEFVPTPEEQRLYDLVSEYLQRPNLYALPSSQRQLMTLILRKLLASSTYAISNTLEGLANRLQAATVEAEAIQSSPDELAENFEELPEFEDEWLADDEEAEGAEEPGRKKLSPEQIREMQEEMAALREFHALAISIAKNSKGEVLLTALRRGFAAAKKVQKNQHSALQQKALIFTESRRTQDYLFRILEQTEFAGKVVLFNGSNTDAKSQEIYHRWLERNAGTDRVTNSPTADKRAALVEYFRDEAAIMIATEAAAEGINLQFCNLVVNYDLPWNPQRIEQRIGRCHRYGQKFDVVVVNFLNRNNAADLRVYQLLDEKFRLFNGVFGASDEVLGAIESGVDFEKRIVGIYQRCRTPEQISFEFDQLQHELESDIDDKRREAREQLLNNFDQEVIERVRVSSNDYLDRFEEWLWQITRFYLQPYARFEASGYGFVLERSPFDGDHINPGPYRLGKRVDEANTYRIGHPLAQRILAKCKALASAPSELTFRYADSGKRIAVLDSLTGQAGWLLCTKLSVTAFEAEDHILFAGVNDVGDMLDQTQCRRLFDLPAEEGGAVDDHDGIRERLNERIMDERQHIGERLNDKNGHWFDAEMDKLDRWAEDQRKSLKAALEELDVKIKETRKDARSAPNLPTKLELQRQLRQLEEKRNVAWREYDEDSRNIEVKKDTLLDEISQRLNQQTEQEDLFLIRWHLI